MLLRPMPEATAYFGIPRQHIKFHYITDKFLYDVLSGNLIADRTARAEHYTLTFTIAQCTDGLSLSILHRNFNSYRYADFDVMKLQRHLPGYHSPLTLLYASSLRPLILAYH
jgi:hypothetical protein